MSLSSQISRVGAFPVHSGLWMVVTLPFLSFLGTHVSSSHHQSTSEHITDDLQTSHLLGNGPDTTPGINSYSNRAQCQGLYLPHKNINNERPDFEHSILKRG